MLTKLIVTVFSSGSILITLIEDSSNWYDGLSLTTLTVLSSTLTHSVGASGVVVAADGASGVVVTAVGDSGVAVEPVGASGVVVAAVGDSGVLDDPCWSFRCSGGLSPRSEMGEAVGLEMGEAVGL